MVRAASIALVGLPGSGKSSVGRQLARRLRAHFVDSDAAIEQRIGESIRSFFAREGERRFRDIEQGVIAELAADQSVGVLATGGGAVLRESNRALLASAYTVVYLRASPEEIHRRLRRDTQRPLLQVVDPQAALRKLYEDRDPLYREIANFTIDTGRPTVHALVSMVLMQLELAGCIDPTHAPAGGDGNGPRVERSSP